MNYKVYIQTDEQGRVTAVNSDAFIPEDDIENWIEIDEGEGDRYMHSQGNYLLKSLTTEQGIYRYKLVLGKAVERTTEEIQADIDAIPPPPPTQDEVITAMRPLVNVMSMGQPAEVVLPLAPMLYEWEEGIWETNRNLTYEGQVYKVLAPGHDSTGNPGWKPGLPETANLFMIWHGVSEDTAQPWIKPTGQHDMYLKDEWKIYRR